MQTKCAAKRNIWFTVSGNLHSNIEGSQKIETNFSLLQGHFFFNLLHYLGEFQSTVIRKKIKIKIETF